MKFFSSKVLTFFLAVFLMGQVSYAATYKVDLDHTSLSFKIRHLLSNVQGQFKEFDGKIDYDPEHPENASVEGTVKSASIDTNVAPRDKHLRSADFFDVEKYPALTFKSTKFIPDGKEKGKLEGVLTIHGVEKSVVFDVDIHGVAKDPWGNVRAAFTATTKINRKDFGLNWNQAIETGQLLVGEEVNIILEVEGIQES